MLSGIAGLVHATLGVGSMVAGLSVAALPTWFGYPARVLLAALGLFLLSLPLLDTHTLSRLFVVALVLGPVVAPYMISVFMLGERAAPPSRVGAAMTLLAGATGVGYAIGSPLAGHLADEHAHPGAFAVAVTAAGFVALLAAAAQPLLRRLTERDSSEAAAAAASGERGLETIALPDDQ